MKTVTGSSIKKIGVICLIGCLVIPLYAAIVSASDLLGRPLFRDARLSEKTYPKVNPKIVTRQRVVMIDLEWFNRRDSQAYGRLNLFGDLHYLATHLNTEIKGPQKFAWLGHLSGEPDGRITLVVDGDQLSGTISLDNARYDIRPLKEGRHVIREIDLMELAAATRGVISQDVDQPNLLFGRSNTDFQTSATMGTFENEVFLLVNQERAIRDMGLLNPDDRLTDAARAHSQDMSDNRYFSHTSQDGRSFSERISAAGYQWSGCGENIAYGYSTATAVMNGWMNSSGHRANILSDRYCDLGVGYAADGHYWTQDFGRLQGVSQCAVPDNSDPFASFTATPTSGWVPLEVSFDASASQDSDGDPLTFQWDFGDGSSGDGLMVTHQYTLPGLYSVQLTVSDPDGGNDAAVTEITVRSSNNSAPRATDDTFECQVNHALTIDAPGVLQNDSDLENPQALAVELISSPAHGVLTLQRNGAFHYEPESDYSGEDTFDYVVTDGELQSDPARVTISVQASDNSDESCFIQTISSSD